VLELVYVSALFAVVLTPAVHSIEKISIRKWHPGRGIAILTLLLTVIVFFVGLFYFALPPVIRDLKYFAEDLPVRGPQLLAKLHHLPMIGQLDLHDLTDKLQQGAASSAGWLIASLPAWAERMVDIITTLILTVYFLLEGEFAYLWFLSLFPLARRTRLNATLVIARARMSRWLIGQGTLMLIIGLCSTAVFALLHVRYSILLGVLMGVANIVPVAGAVVSVTIAALVAALDSWTKMLGVLIFYAIYVNIENAYLVPRIMKRNVNLAGLVVLIALLAGATLAGVVGAMVAVPTAALIAVLMDEYMVVHDEK